MSATTIIFDVGMVLLNWEPHKVWAPELGEAETEAFMTRINFAALNLRADGGETFADLATEIADPDDAARFAAYPALFGRAIENGIPGMWDVLDQLRAKGVTLNAITNFSAECWPVAVDLHPRLGASFQTLVVSGREKMIKPDPAIFQLMLDRAGLAPGECLFIDDSAKNIAAAAAMGIETHHFHAAAALRADLTGRGFL